MKEIVEDALKKIADISYLLSWDEKLSDAERKGLFKERNSHIFWLERLDGTRAKQAFDRLETWVERKHVDNLE